MSHLKEYKTNIDNLEYLRGALERLNVSYYVSGQNIILPQKEFNIASFQWNGNNYTLFYDLDFWSNPLTVNSFAEKVVQEYSTEKVTRCMKKFGFITESYEDVIKLGKYQTIKEKDLVLSRYSF